VIDTILFSEHVVEADLEINFVSHDWWWHNPKCSLVAPFPLKVGSYLGIDAGLMLL